MSYRVSTENEEKRILHPKRCFGNGFSETVMTNAVLTDNDGKVTMHQNVRDSFARKTCPFHVMICPFS